MVEIVNLRRVRKAKAREAAAATAAENRARTGTTKAERLAAAEREKTLQRTLDGALLEDDPPPG